MATVYRYVASKHDRPMLSPAPMPGFNSERAARRFAAGYVCVPRVVADRRTKRERFVVVHPSTAKRRGWKVVAS